MESKFKNQQVSNSAGYLIKKGNELRRLGQLDEAIAYYKEAQEIVPSSSIVCQNLGDALVEKEDFEEAIIEYRKAIATNPSCIWLYYSLGKALIEKGEILEAKKWLQKGIQKKPDIWQFYNQLGKALIQEGKGKAAIACLRKGLEINSKAWEIYQSIAEAKIKDKQNEEAILFYEEALALNPKKSSIYGDLGEMFYKENNFQQAIFYFQKAIEINPDCARFYDKMGQSAVQIGKLSQAWFAFEASIQSHPSCSLLKRNQQLETKQDYYLFHNKDREKLTEEPQWIVVSIKPKSTYWLSGNVASEAFPSGNAALVQFQFLDEYQKVISPPYEGLSHSKHVGPYQYIRVDDRKPSPFLVQFQTPNRAKYVKLGFRHWSSKEPVWIESRIELKQLYFETIKEPPLKESSVELENLNKSWCNSSKKTDNSYRSYIYNIKSGNTAYKKQDWQKASREYNEALKKQPDSAWLHYQLAKVLVKQKKLENAISHLEKAIALRPDFAGHYKILGNIWSQKQELSKAAAAYEKARKLDATFEFPYETLRRMYNIDNLGGWAIGEELYLYILQFLSPGATILELGSGTGTQELSKYYNMISVEHNKDWLNRYKSKYIYAPLVNDFWYDATILAEELDGINYDLLLVDGPPQHRRVGILEHLNLFHWDVPIILDDMVRTIDRYTMNYIANYVNKTPELYRYNRNSFAVLQ